MLDDKLYVAGGFGLQMCAALQVFDGATWTRKADLPTSRCQSACVAVDGRVMFIGGQSWPEGDSAEVRARARASRPPPRRTVS